MSDKVTYRAVWGQLKKYFLNFGHILKCAWDSGDGDGDGDGDCDRHGEF